MFILTSIATFCLSTHVDFRVPRYNGSFPLDKDWTYQEKNQYSKPHPVLDVMDIVCIVYFMLEFILRLSTSPSKTHFFVRPLNWVDLFSIVPYFIEKLIVLIDPSLELSWVVQLLNIIRLVSTPKWN